MAMPETKKEIDTPALVLDIKKLKRNIQKMADFFRDKPAGLRPHFKTPKTVEIAKMQLAAGAVGITCAKLGEAELLVEAGVKDILIANEIIGPNKIERLIGLVKKCPELKIAVDSETGVDQLSEAASKAGVEVGVLVEINVGMPRCGVAPEAGVALARLVSKSKGVKLAGVMGYEGHIVLNEDRERREQECKKSMTALVGAKEMIEKAGMECRIVSGGGTGTYYVTGAFPGVTEVQAGSYCLMDTRYDKLGLGFEKAVTILTTVISNAFPGFLITDAGEKMMSIEFGMPELIGFPTARMLFLSEEHGHLQFTGDNPGIKIGDQGELYPSHICTTLNLNDWLWVADGDKVVDRWKIAGRGKSQ
jgi:D-serine deaminase-like pyridoxal phosphate-dependent protein